MNENNLINKKRKILNEDLIDKDLNICIYCNKNSKNLNKYDDVKSLFDVLKNNKFYLNKYENIEKKYENKIFKKSISCCLDCLKKTKNNDELLNYIFDFEKNTENKENKLKIRIDKNFNMNNNINNEIKNISDNNKLIKEQCFLKEINIHNDSDTKLDNILQCNKKALFKTYKIDTDLNQIKENKEDYGLDKNLNSEEKCVKENKKDENLNNKNIFKISSEKETEKKNKNCNILINITKEDQIFNKKEKINNKINESIELQENIELTKKNENINEIKIYQIQNQLDGIRECINLQNGLFKDIEDLITLFYTNINNIKENIK